jgi:medium-chain acyl-[acyl-carrier-protein] hydrolase
MGYRLIDTKNTWLTHARANGASQLRLFCFPYSGAGASVFYPWVNAFPSAIEVCPVQLPGRESRLSEPPFTHLAPLVEAAGRALLPYLDRPFACFGHSLGALLSFELARYWQRHYGLTPVHLFVSAHPAPHVPDTEAPISQLPEPEFLQKLRDLNGMSEEILKSPELLQLLLPILRADFSACETYLHSPGEPLTCPISAFGGVRDPYMGRHDLEAWQAHTQARFAIRMFPGDHFYLRACGSMVVEAIARDLASYLPRTDPRTPRI